MTDTEKQHQRVRLHVQLEDPVKEMKHRRERIRGYLDAMRNVSERLAYNVRLEPSANDFECNTKSPAASRQSRWQNFAMPI